MELVAKAIVCQLLFALIKIMLNTGYQQVLRFHTACTFSNDGVESDDFRLCVGERGLLIFKVIHQI